MASMIRRRRRLSGESGAELVELAIVLPLLLILIAGIADFAFLFQSFEVVTNAAREGARIGVLPGYGTADIQNRVAAYVTAAGLPGTPVTTVTTPTITPGGGGPSFPAVRVSVAYTHQYLFIGPMVTLIGATFAANKSFTTVSVMRTEVAP
jgi:Flp pilus assembly protein TadG